MNLLTFISGEMLIESKKTLVEISLVMHLKYKRLIFLEQIQKLLVWVYMIELFVNGVSNSYLMKTRKVLLQLMKKRKNKSKNNYIEDIKIHDDSLINELNYSFASSNQQEKFSDSAVLIRASNSKIINKILSK
jgi:hypothetical protein